MRFIERKYTNNLFFRILRFALCEKKVVDLQS